MKGETKASIIIFIIVAAIIAVIVCADFGIFRTESSENTNSTQQIINNTIEEEHIKQKKQPVLLDIDLLAKELNQFKTKDYTTSQEDIRNAVRQLEKWSSTIIDEAKTKDKVRIKKIKILNTQLKNIQIAAFPILRSKYRAFVAKNLWRDNIKVSGGGATIRYSGGVFANNAMIEDFHNIIRIDLELLRFKRAEYLWMDYANDYTYYTIDSPKDSKLLD